MNNDFECIRCGYTTNKKSSMNTHLNRKNKCNKKLESFKYTDEEAYNISIIRKNNRDNIQNKCNFCNKICNNQESLEKHMNNSCKKNFKIENHNTVNQTINNDNTVNNNIYIIQNINMPLTFDKDWSTEHIDIFLKQLLLLAENKYTDLLKKILENKENLNVILDKKTNIGYVYDKNNEYKNMEKSDIVSLSMEKLHSHLNKIKDEVLSNDNKISIKNINEESQKIEDKYNEFINNKNTQKKVEEYISDIFDTKKEDAYQFFNNNNNYIKDEGY